MSEVSELLPPLPKPARFDYDHGADMGTPVYSEAQMRKYALDTIRRAEARQAPLPAGTVTDKFLSKFQLWFFRDMTDDQRRKLFGIFGMPVDDLSTHGAQQIALRHILEAAFAARPAEPVSSITETGGAK